MKAMILAAGLGTRLKELTQEKPKALVEVAGKPLLAHVLNKLIASGFDEIVINVHHFAQQVIDYLKNNYSSFTIHISDESNQLLDTGGGILKAKPFLAGNEPFLVHNVDIISDIDLQQLMKFHLERECLATLAVSNRDSSRKLLFDTQIRLRGWKNLNTGETIIPGNSTEDLIELAFSGVHVISPTIYNHINSTGAFSIIKTYLSLCEQHHISGFPVSHNFVIDVGKPEGLASAEKYLAKQ